MRKECTPRRLAHVPRRLHSPAAHVHQRCSPSGPHKLRAAKREKQVQAGWTVLHLDTSRSHVSFRFTGMRTRPEAHHTCQSTAIHLRHLTATQIMRPAHHCNPACRQQGDEELCRNFCEGQQCSCNDAVAPAADMRLPEPLKVHRAAAIVNTGSASQCCRLHVGVGMQNIRLKGEDTLAQHTPMQMKMSSSSVS